MYKFFDYIFFRAFKFYQKETQAIPIDRGIQVVSIWQIVVFFSIFAVLDFFFKILPYFDQKYFNKYVLGLPLSLSFLLINEVRYKRMGKRDGFKSFHEAWGNERQKSKKVNGWLIIIVPILLLVSIPFLLSFIKHYCAR